ncbi:MAG: winged helix-turn-helix transcriptional regulator [Pirellulaceae bacterium]|nr:winged helix-turn-helix transcriptional regulator [Pirellulaceae bacterium]
MSSEPSAFEALRRITRAADLYSRWLLREHRLTAPQHAILTELARHREAPVGVLAKAAFVGPPTATGIIDRLERQGLVERVRRTLDRRQVFVALTPAGQQLLDRGPPALSDQFEAQLGQLSDSERQQVSAVLQRVAGLLEAAMLSEVPAAETGDAPL